MTRVVRYHTPGPPSVLVVEEEELPPPGPGEARLRHTAIGVNFLDVNFRSGAYPSRAPASLGTEGVGVIVATGPGVSHLQPGERVAYYWRQQGSYREERNVPAERLLHLPDEISDDVAASTLVKGLTAEYLLRRTVRVDASHTIVVTAAAGGVGGVMCQWGRALGARVIGIVSTDEKARAALQAGAHHVLVMNKGVGDRPDLAARVRELCPDGVDVVYDSIGKDTFVASLDMLKPRGTLVLFGQSSGPVAPFDPALLAHKGSLYLTRPSLGDYTADPGEYRAAADALFDAVKKGIVTARIAGRFALADAAAAHTELEARKTAGALVLVP
jgi:NADPH:quinone reductase